MKQDKLISYILIILIAIISTGCGNYDQSVYDQSVYVYPNTPEEVWGDLEYFEGERVWGTLTKEQRALVNYPELDEECVYWVPNGKAYHAMDWCYTLWRSKDIRSGTLEEAKKTGKLYPCSKCVGYD